jgi:hypothetical protein
MVAASGAKPKSRTNRMERARRISPTYYMNFGIRRDSGKRAAFRYHRCISNSLTLIERFNVVSSENVCLGERVIRC